MLNEHLEHFVNQALLETPELSAHRIDVVASDGRVTLSGKVQTFKRKLKAQQVARDCKGVRKVDNQLQVVSPDSISDLEIAKRINKKMSKDTNLKDQAIRIDVHQGCVTLTGYVAFPSSRDTVADIARSVDNVRDVVDLLVVNPDRVLANQEHGTAILAAIDRTIGMEDEKIVVSVVDEMARVSGTVDAPWKRDSVEQTVRQFGILKVCNEIVIRR